MVNALLVLMLFVIMEAVASAAAAPSGRRRCDNAPSKLVRIGLTADSPLTPAAKEIVETAWRTEGLAFEWLVLSVGNTLNELDLMVLVDENNSVARRSPAHWAPSATRFVGGQPQKIVSACRRVPSLDGSGGA